jgi:Recombination endonuclease VII
VARKGKGKGKGKGKKPKQGDRDQERRRARQRQWHKERYCTDPDFRGRRRAACGRYRAANKDEINAKQRERYKTDPEYRERKRAIGLRSSLKRQLKKHGMSVEDYEAMLLRQGGVCGICKRPPGKRRLGVDHCHKTGQVRGLLCSKCNSGIGFYGDDARLTREAAAYLEAALGDEPQ